MRTLLAQDGRVQGSHADVCDCKQCHWIELRQQRRQHGDGDAKPLAVQLLHSYDAIKECWGT